MQLQNAEFNSPLSSFECLDDLTGDEATRRDNCLRARAARRLAVAGSQSAPRRPFVPVECARARLRGLRGPLPCRGVDGLTTDSAVVAGRAPSSLINAMTCLVADNSDDVSGGFMTHGYRCFLQSREDRVRATAPDTTYTRLSQPAVTVATYDSYPYNRMASMGYPPPPMPPSSASRVQAGGKLGLLPYSVNGVSLTSPPGNLLHPAMGYQGTSLFNSCLGRVLNHVL